MIQALEQSAHNLDYLDYEDESYSSPAILSYLTSMLYISNEINELFSFEVLANKDLLPKK